MLPRIYFWLAIGMLPLSAQTSLNDGGRLYPQNQPTVQPTQPNGPATLQPGVNAPPQGIPAPAPGMPATPLVKCRMKEFTITPTTFRAGMTYKDSIKTTIMLNVPAPRRMVFHIATSDPVRVICDDIVILKDVQSNSAGINIKWKSFTHDTSVEFKAYLVDDPDTILHGRMYIKPKIE